jgi:hypothetical protein
MDRQYNDQKKKRRTDNTMNKRKREGQTIQWPNEKEDRQYFGYCIVCPSLFPLVIVLSVLLFFF